MPKTALGKGLGALIPDIKGAGVTEIDIKDIKPSEYQPRKRFDETQLEELTLSIKAKGVIQPIIVRRTDDGGYSLIAGERRWRAARMAGLKKIPAIVRDVTEAERVELALIENLQREDLNPIETAEACNRLIKDFHLTQEDLSKVLGKQRSSIANYLRLLKLPYDVKQWITKGDITMGHAKSILSLEKPGDQIDAGRRIIKKGLSVRQAEFIVRRMLKPKATIKKKKDFHFSDLEEGLKRFLGTKVNIQRRRKGGKIEIEYYSDDDLTRIIEILKKGGLDV
ncbi:MAG: ParB/RepB/Spo0J family partition protein [Nitrospirae bacterium]|nr:ParB/RepB/Spo0J family partition protein [Nitrospirota bacterium]